MRPEKKPPAADGAAGAFDEKNATDNTPDPARLSGPQRAELIYEAGEELDAHEVAVLLAFNSRSWGEASASFESVDTIARRTRLARRTVQGAAARLVTRGIVLVKSQPGRVNVWAVNWPKIAAMAAGAKVTTPAKPKRTRAPRAPHPRTACAGTTCAPGAPHPRTACAPPAHTVRPTCAPCAPELVSEPDSEPESELLPSGDEVRAAHAAERWNGEVRHEDKQALVNTWNSTPGRRATLAEARSFVAALSALSLDPDAPPEARAHPVSFVLDRARKYVESREARKDGGFYKARLQNWLLPGGGKAPRYLEDPRNWEQGEKPDAQEVDLDALIAEGDRRRGKVPPVREKPENQPPVRADLDLDALIAEGDRRRGKVPAVVGGGA